MNKKILIISTSPRKGGNSDPHWTKPMRWVNGCKEVLMKQRFTTFLAALFFSLSMALPASATVSDTGYSDVDAGAWYAESVTWCRENNLMAGVGGGRFAPDNTLTWAMLAAVLQRLSDTQPGTSPSEGEETMLHITVNGTTLTATLANNSSAEAFRELLASGPRTIQMSDYGNFEKVGPLGQSLPTNNQQITTEAGDIILYQGNQITIYYDRNSWNFTRLGKINGVTSQQLRDILGSGDVSVTFSLEKGA